MGAPLLHAQWQRPAVLQEREGHHTAPQGICRCRGEFTFPVSFDVGHVACMHMDNFQEPSTFLCNPLYANSCHHIHMMLRTFRPMS